MFVKLRDISPLYHASEINKPLLIIHGRYDDTVPLEQAKEMEKALSELGKDFQLRVIEGVGHSLEDSKSLGYILDQSNMFFNEHLKSNPKESSSGK